MTRHIDIDVSGVWRAAYVPPPPGQPACAGHDPELFVTEKVTPEAYAICRSCPVDVKRWCLATVQPKRGQFSGLCGGRVWWLGKHITTPHTTRGKR